MMRREIFVQKMDLDVPSPRKKLLTPTQDKWHCHTLVCEGCQICQCTSLFGKTVRIKGTPESAVKKIGSLSISRRSAKKRTMTTAISGTGRQSCPEMGTNDLISTASSLIDASAIFDPEAQNVTPQKIYDPRICKARCPLEEFDPNSQDSGYSANFSDEKCPRVSANSAFQFVEPSRAAPKLRLSLDSPRKSPHQSPYRPQSRCQSLFHHTALFRSLSSGYESTDDGFADLIDMEGLESAEESENDNGLPISGFSSLITGSLVQASKVDTTPESSRSRPTYSRIRRSLSLQVDRTSPETPSNKVRSCLFRSPNATSSVAKLTFDENPRLGFKRPEPPSELSPLRAIKRAKKTDNDEEKETNSSLLHRSFSESAIKSAMIRDETQDHLTGDFSKPCCLPITDGGSSRHRDLKLISVHTLTKLLGGGFESVIGDYKIVDCRYPYEFEGGHIRGAINLYSKEMIEEFLLDTQKTEPKIDSDQAEKRRILVFHCEFSFERGPNLSRVLRSLDRQRNESRYPALHYPEIYLLHGGYRQFFEEEKAHCQPLGYCQMRDPKYENELRRYSKNFSKSKSWQDQKPSKSAKPIGGGGSNRNLGYKRLGF